jgi:selenocysteine lyase/cysteine desulfurase
MSRHTYYRNYSDNDDEDYDYEDLMWAFQAGANNLLQFVESDQNINVYLAVLQDSLDQPQTNENTNTENFRHALETLVGISYYQLQKLQNKRNDTCAICIENFNKDDLKHTFVQLECNHIYHRECIMPVTRNACPLCNEPIIKNFN